MKFDPEKHHRRSIRLRGFDYKQSGTYFVTTVTRDRACLLADIIDGEIRLNDAGRMVNAAWTELSIHYPGVENDAFVVMPNHIHGVIVLVGAGPRACPEQGHPRADMPANNPAVRLGQPQGVAPTLSLPDVVHRFKTLTTKRYADGVKRFGWVSFPNRLWQRNYYEHVIRDEESLNRIRKYILDNPVQWAFDRENPAATTPEAENAWQA